MTVPVPTILSEGKAMDPTYRLVSLEVVREVNRIPDATLVLVDGSVARQRFEVSDSGFFEPGKTVEIKLRYEGQDDVRVFRGVVVRHGVRASGDHSMLEVELKDASIKLTQPRKSAVFRGRTDDEVFHQLLSDAGLQIGQLSTTKAKHPELVQYDATDWDFMVSRADVNGQVVVVCDGEVSVRKLVLEGKPVATLTYGLDEIFELELEIDATGQPTAVQTVAWDVAAQARISSSAATAPKAKQGNLDGGDLAGALGFAGATLPHPVPMAAEELEAWAGARMARGRLSMIRGRLVTTGRSDVGVFDLVGIAGVGKRFNGSAVVGGIRHHLDHDGWRTELSLGVSPDWFCHRERIAESPAAGLLPPVSGLHVGVVDTFEKDPDGEHRVKVRLPTFAPEHGSLWARMVYPDAGKGRGLLVWPEPDDEVVVGFFNDDPRRPVVLGAMFSSAHAPPKEIGARTEDNFVKGLVTKAGTQIALDDDKGSITIKTPAQRKVVIDDDAQSITIADDNGNEIVLDSSGITLKTDGDFKIDASGNVEISGSAVDVK